MRFPGFEGEWETKKLGEVANVSSGGTPNRANPLYWNGNIPWISTTLIDFNYIEKSEEYITKEGLKNSSAKIFPIGTLLMAMYGQGKTRGKVSVLNIEATTNQACGAITTNKDILYSLFAFQNLSKRYDEIRELSNQGGQENLSAGIIKGIEISFPSIPEQQKIASCLSLIDERIQTQNKIIEQLETLIINFRNQIFKQKIRFKDENGIDFFEWKEVKIGDILQIGNGKDYKHLQSGKVPVFGTGGFMTLVDNFLYDGETVCIGRKGTIDKPMYHEGKIWTVDTLFYTHSFQSCIPKFIFYLFQTINWLEYNEASGVPSLSKSTIEKIKIEIPSINEQKQIATFLSKIDKKIQAEKAILEQLEKQKKYLLHQMFV